MYKCKQENGAAHHIYNIKQQTLPTTKLKAEPESLSCNNKENFVNIFKWCMKKVFDLSIYT